MQTAASERCGWNFTEDEQNLVRSYVLTKKLSLKKKVCIEAGVILLTHLWLPLCGPHLQYYPLDRMQDWFRLCLPNDSFCYQEKGPTSSILLRHSSSHLNTDGVSHFRGLLLGSPDLAEELQFTLKPWEWTLFTQGPPERPLQTSNGKLRVYCTVTRLHWSWLVEWRFILARYWMC